MLDLSKDIKKIKISKDPDSYSTLVYGPVKIGKSTFVHKLFKDKVLFLETESRERGLVGADVAPISNWVDFISALNQLDTTQELHKCYKVICVDTVDSLVKLLEDFVKQHFQEDQLGNAPFGKDYRYCKDQWQKYTTMIHKIGYTPFYVAHSQTKDITIPANEKALDKIKGSVSKVRDGAGLYYQFKQTIPNLPEKYLAPINKSVDEIVHLGYEIGKDGQQKRVAHLRNSFNWMAGSTFPKIKPTIPLNAVVYQQTLRDAVATYSKDQQTAADYNQKEKAKPFKDLIAETKRLGFKLHQLGKDYILRKVTLDSVGEGHKLLEAKEDQREMVELANFKLHREVEKAK